MPDVSLQLAYRQNHHFLYTHGFYLFDGSIMEVNHIKFKMDYFVYAEVLLVSPLAVLGMDSYEPSSSLHTLFSTSTPNEEKCLAQNNNLNNTM